MVADAAGGARTRADRLRRLDEDEFDDVVVGAGVGGLTAAALLAANGRRVLVAERHHAAGGNATMFRRSGYEFDVGVHYVGGCQAGGPLARILEAVGANDLRFHALDADGFDTFVFPDLTFRVPAGMERYRTRLLETFPAQAGAIDAFLGRVGELRPLLTASRVDGPLSLVATVRKLEDVTLAKVLDGLTDDVHLRAVLSAQGGLYGLPPSRASFAVHALMLLSYLDGAYYPAGGGQALSDALVAAVERNGGRVVLGAAVERIGVSRGAVTGVTLASKHLGGRRTIRARAVVSNADVKRTFLELLRAEDVAPRTVARARRWEMSTALASLYLGVRRDFRREGVPRTNYNLVPSYDLEAAYAAVAAGRLPDAQEVFVSITSVKDPGNARLAPPGISNLQLIVAAPAAPAAWGVTEEDVESGAYRDRAAYARRKDEVSARLVERGEALFPGLAGQIEFSELATPLSHRRFTAATGGTGYGLAAVPTQGPTRRPGPRTEIRGLFLCGASARRGHGILGAMLSGADAASEILRRNLFEDG